MDIMICDQYPNILILQMGNDFLDIFHGNRIDAGKRLIEKDKMRIYCQRTGNLGPSPLAS